MSDARAKAEARRAKILARDSSKRTVSAVIDTVEEPVRQIPSIAIVYIYFIICIPV
jgi:hypothetical protein